jgi:hypothetical protein
MEPENSYQKLITKYPAPKARKIGIAKITKYRHEVTIIGMEEMIVMGHEINGGDDGGNPTQVAPNLERFRARRRNRFGSRRQRRSWKPRYQIFW